MDEDWQGTYELHGDEQGVYAMVVEGGRDSWQKTRKRDALGFGLREEVEINAKKGSKILLIEVPMR